MSRDRENRDGRIAPQASARFKEREQTRRTRGISLRRWSRNSRLICEDGSHTSATVKRPRCCKALKGGYAADCGQWCGSNGSADGQGSASFANGALVRTWRQNRRESSPAPGGSQTRPLCTLPCPMPTLPSSGFHPPGHGPSLSFAIRDAGPRVGWCGRGGWVTTPLCRLNINSHGSGDCARLEISEKQIPGCTFCLLHWNRDVFVDDEPVALLLLEYHGPAKVA